jgi:hypothetical protein
LEPVIEIIPYKPFSRVSYPYGVIRETIKQSIEIVGDDLFLLFSKPSSSKILKDTNIFNLGILTFILNNTGWYNWFKKQLPLFNILEKPYSYPLVGLTVQNSNPNPEIKVDIPDKSIHTLVIVVHGLSVISDSYVEYQTLLTNIQNMYTGKEGILFEYFDWKNILVDEAVEKIQKLISDQPVKYKTIREIVLQFYSDYINSGVLDPRLRLGFGNIVKKYAAKLKHNFNIAIISHSMGGYIVWQATRELSRFYAQTSQSTNPDFVDKFLQTNDVYWISSQTPQITIARPQDISVDEIQYNIIKEFKNYLHPKDLISLPEVKLDGTVDAEYIEDKNLYTIPHGQLFSCDEFLNDIKTMIDHASDVSPANPKNVNNPNIIKRPYGIDIYNFQLNNLGRIQPIIESNMVPGWNTPASGYDFVKNGNPFI